MVRWCSDLLATNWSSAIRGSVTQLSNAENSKRINMFMQVDRNKIDYPVALPIEAR